MSITIGRRGRLQIQPRSCNEGTDLSWDRCVTEFLRHERVKGRKPRTLDLHRESLQATKADLERLGLSTVPVEVTASDIERVLENLMDRGRTTRTINLRIQSLRQFFAFLEKQGWVINNPTVELTKQREERRIPRTLTDSDVTKLLRQQDQTSFTGLRDHVILLVWLDTGLRVSETVNLNVDDVDLDAGTLLVRQAKDGEQRQAYLSPPTIHWLRMYLAERGSIPGLEALFVSRDNRRMTTRGMQQNLRRHCERAGITRVTPHGIRHTFARCYILAGGDVFSLQRLLGHSDMEMVRRYVEIWGTDVQQQHRRFSPVRRFVADPSRPESKIRPLKVAKASPRMPGDDPN